MRLVSDPSIQKIIKRFEATGRLEILRDRGREQVDNCSVNDVATAAVDLSYGNASFSAIANEIDTPISSVKKVMCNILSYYLHKIQRV
ncbi:hypothetical protein NPIL_403541 [Nephila pilipes]|uniref:DUF4817 domain-containing protein n=1 Tax=Nephila pilipes TaxID=299642 RepID=A0A8X6NRK1_NEPPI|nr:hypothetical protein NPIL_403541 [Nephila pilipes]